jgi:hypothetical protein
MRFLRSWHTSVIEGGGGGGGGVGGRGGHPLLIDHISSGMFLTPRNRIREHTWRKFLTKLKIMYKKMGLALYCFNVKNIAAYTLTFQKKKCNLSILHFF